MTASRRTRRALTLVVAVSLLLTQAPLTSAAGIPEPALDPFYVPDDGYESSEPGTVLRQRTVTVTGLGLPIPVEATQALVRSTDAKGEPMAIVTTLMVPSIPYAGAGPRPLLSYQPAIDSLGDQCQPSYTLQTGTQAELALMSAGLGQGWAVVVTDYQGPEHAFAAGRLEGQATLDGIRAALSLPGTGLAGAETPVGLWGYSGGALASGWAAQLHPTYAPELDVVGVAAGGTPANLQQAGRTIDGTIYSGLFLSAAVGVSRAYPEVRTILNARGVQLVEDIGDTCVAEATASYPFRRLREFTTVSDPLSDPLVAGVLAENRMGQTGPTAPVYLYHSRWDQLIPYSGATTLRSEWCRAGTTVTFVTDYLSEHIAYAVTGAPGAVAFLTARFAGLSAPSSCPS